MRLGQIKNVLFFDHEHLTFDEEEWTPVEGPCLVEYRDGRLAQAYIPPHDVRIQCAPLRSIYSRTAALRGHAIQPLPGPARSVKSWRACVCGGRAPRVRAA